MTHAASAWVVVSECCQHWTVCARRCFFLLLLFDWVPSPWRSSWDEEQVRPPERAFNGFGGKGKDWRYPSSGLI